METNQDWSIEWVIFFDEYAGDFHPSFRKKLARQLFEKGDVGTGIHGFKKYYFQLLIGQDDLKMQQIEENMFAVVSFITPPAYSQFVWIYWKAEGVDLINLQSKDVSAIDIEFHWGGNFPKEETLSWLKPYKKEKKGKSNLHFDVEYYYNAFPDISFELVFVKQPEEKEIEVINNFIKTFLNEWNKKNSDKVINYLSPLIKQTERKYELIGDFGIDNAISIVRLLFKELSNQIGSDVISKIVLK